MGGGIHMACKGIKNFLKMSRPKKVYHNRKLLCNQKYIDRCIGICVRSTKVESRGKIYFHYAETKRIYEL